MGGWRSCHALPVAAVAHPLHASTLGELSPVPPAHAAHLAATYVLLKLVSAFRFNCGFLAALRPARCHRRCPDYATLACGLRDRRTTATAPASTAGASAAAQCSASDVITHRASPDTGRLPKCPKRRLLLACISHQIATCEPDDNTHSRRTSCSWAAATPDISTGPASLPHKLAPSRVIETCRSAPARCFMPNMLCDGLVSTPPVLHSLSRHQQVLAQRRQCEY